MKQRARSGASKLFHFGDLRLFAWRTGLVLVTTLAVTVLISSQFPWDTVRVEVGDISPRTVSAPREGRVIDQAATERRIAERLANVRKVYDVDNAAVSKALATVNRALDLLATEMREHGTDPVSEQARRVEAKLSVPISASALSGVLQTGDPALAEELREYATGIIQRVYTENQIRDDTNDLLLVRGRVAELSESLPIRESHRRFVADLVQRAIKRPNLLYNPTLTEQAREDAKRTVDPVFDRIAPGEVVLTEGQRVTPEDIERLKAVGLYRHATDWSRVAGVFLLVLFFCLVLGAYVRLYLPSSWRSLAHLSLVSLLLVCAVLALRLTMRFSWANNGAYVSAMVIGAAAMMIAVLLDSRLAVVKLIVLSLLAPLAINQPLPHSVAAVAVGLAGIFAVRRITDRMHLLRSAGLLAAVNGFMVGVCVLLNTAPQTPLSSQFLTAILCGAATPVLLWGGVMFLERPFGITTDLRLLELSNLNQPILRRLLREAPGTYHASLVMSNLAETAAEAIGADSLLTRVSCFYHDIGKLKRPNCFVENLFGADNVHENLSPHLSALAIMAHVKDGVELAQELRLPQPLIDIIPQHHGTTLVSYFYHRAVAEEGEDAVDEESFRYQGPKPQTREAAIVMLADGVEAGVRSLKDPTVNAVAAMVDRIIDDRVKDGQLDESNLTFRDLETVRRTFLEIIRGMFHERIEYPKDAQDAARVTARKNGKDGGGDAHRDRGESEHGLATAATGDGRRRSEESGSSGPDG